MCIKKKSFLENYQYELFRSEPAIYCRGVRVRNIVFDTTKKIEK